MNFIISTCDVKCETQVTKIFYFPPNKNSYFNIFQEEVSSPFIKASFSMRVIVSEAPLWAKLCSFNIIHITIKLYLLDQYRAIKV